MEKPLSPSGKEAYSYGKITIETWIFSDGHIVEGFESRVDVPPPQDIGIFHLWEACEQLLRLTGKRWGSRPEKLLNKIIEDAMKDDKSLPAPGNQSPG